MKLKILVLAILSMLATAASADPWLCAGEESTGFIFQNEKWRQTKFNVENEKYILRKLKEGEHFFGAKKQTYGLFTIGNDRSGFPCFCLICVTPQMIAMLNRSARDWGNLYHRAEKAIKTYSEYPPSEPIQA